MYVWNMCSLDRNESESLRKCVAKLSMASFRPNIVKTPEITVLAWERTSVALSAAPLVVRWDVALVADSETAFFYLVIKR